MNITQHTFTDVSDAKLPTRQAPPPPKMMAQLWPKQNGSLSKGNLDKEDPFLERFKISRSQSAGKLGEKKKPPPRPPPPVHFTTNSRSTMVAASNQKQTAQILSKIFTHQKSGNKVKRSQTYGDILEQQERKAVKQVTPCAMLIDLSSPPSSPTLTVHSSSDGFSVNSFGSDGVLTGNNNTGSQIESGFEDDFDLLMATSATTPSLPDLWSDEPYSLRQTAAKHVPFELSNEDPRCRHKESRSAALTTYTVPTIIRPKFNKPARPPPPKIRPASTPPTFVSLPLDQRGDDWSPPMPSCPPPPPPPEVLSTLENGPSLPPRPSSVTQESTSKKKPYCIALFDYDAGHPDDLSFKVNDVIYLTEKVNNDWLRGTLMGKEGIFPASYTKVVVSIDSTWNETPDNSKYVIALFTFKPETWDDLPFQEGETVKVTKRINDHWLYGECNGRQGQFPENYVTDVSSFFPLHNMYS